MSAVDSKKELFENTPVPKAITTMAIPTIISQLINVVYNIVDTFFIGRTGDSYMVAAVTVVFTLFMMTVAISNLFGIGGGSLAARLLGKGRDDDTRKVTAFSFCGAFVVALLYAILVGLLMDPLLTLLGASSATIGYARQYVWMVIVLGSVPIILSTVGAHLLRNVGYSRQASVGLSGGGILNIILDPIFMFVLLPPGLEVFGAAFATLISNVVACVYMVFTLHRVSHSAPISINIVQISGIRKDDVKELFAIGIPSAVLTGLFDVANIVLNNQMAIHGDLELAAIGIVMKVERLPNAFNVGIAQGMLPIVAYNFSSGSRDRMNQVIRTARVYGVFIAITSIVLFELFAVSVVSIFLDASAGDTANALTTIALSAGFLRIRCLASPLQYLNYHTSYCLQAMGDGRDTLFHACARQLVFYIPSMLLLNYLFGKTGLVLAVLVGETCGAIFAMILLQEWLKKCGPC